MQWSCSGANPLGLASGVVEPVVPYRHPHLLRYCHPAAQSSGTPLTRCDSTGRGPIKSLETLKGARPEGVPGVNSREIGFNRFLTGR